MINTFTTSDFEQVYGVTPEQNAYDLIEDYGLDAAIQRIQNRVNYELEYLEDSGNALRVQEMPFLSRNYYFFVETLRALREWPTV